MEFYELIEKYFDLAIRYIVLLIELVGTVVLVYAIVSAVLGLFKRQQHVRLKLAEGIALALEFKIGGELLRTVKVREWSELLIFACAVPVSLVTLLVLNSVWNKGRHNMLIVMALVAAIIALRAALTFLIQWEIKIERKNGNMTVEQLQDIKTPLTQDISRDKVSDGDDAAEPTPEQTQDEND